MQSSFRSVSWLDLASTMLYVDVASDEELQSYSHVAAFLPFPSLHPRFSSFACRTEGGKADERAARVPRSSRFRLREIQIYSSRDFYLIPISDHTDCRISSGRAVFGFFFFFFPFPDGILGMEDISISFARSNCGRYMQMKHAAIVSTVNFYC